MEKHALFTYTRPEAVLIGIGPTEPIPHQVDWSYNDDTFGKETDFQV